MFIEGNIIYFSPFYFKNGNKSKNKFFIVLKNVDNNVIIATLPTKVDKVPSFLHKLHGCINDDERCFNCYLFEPKRVITDNGFGFELHTFIYGNEVDDYDIAILQSVYGIEGVDFDIIGKLLKEEYENLIACLLNSKSIKRGLKKILEKK